MNPFAALGIIVLAIFAIARSDKKLRTLSYIVGWSLSVSIVCGLLGYLLVFVLGGGNAPAVAGDCAGIALDLGLLITSIIKFARKPTATPYGPGKDGG